MARASYLEYARRNMPKDVFMNSESRDQFDKRIEKEGSFLGNAAIGFIATGIGIASLSAVDKASSVPGDFIPGEVVAIAALSVFGPTVVQYLRGKAVVPTMIGSATAVGITASFQAKRKIEEEQRRAAELNNRPVLTYT